MIILSLGTQNKSDTAYRIGKNRTLMCYGHCGVIMKFFINVKSKITKTCEIHKINLIIFDENTLIFKFYNIISKCVEIVLHSQKNKNILG